MAFWTGLLAGATGHQPGAFKGFSLKDILDEDMWTKTQRLRQQPGWDEGLGRYAKVGEPLSNPRTGEPMMTNWYKGMGKPELMGPVVGTPGGGQAVSSVDPATVSRRRRGGWAGPPISAQTQALPGDVAPPPQPLSGNPYKRSWAPGMSEIGGHNVPTMYDPYMFGQRPDQMGASYWNPLNRRIRESKRNQQGLPIAAQYSTGIRDAVKTLGGVASNIEESMFGPMGHRADALRDTGARIVERPTSLLSDAMEYWTPSDRKTVIKRSANPAEADTSTTTITEKMLGPSGHRMGAFKDTAADMWKTIREDDIIKYWMNQFRGN